MSANAGSSGDTRISLAVRRVNRMKLSMPMARAAADGKI